MSAYPHIHHRRSIRLKGYDYSGVAEYVLNNSAKWKDDKFYI
jgi:hypothetical protein